MASKSTSILRRALLYVPASSQKMLTKSLTLTADNITYDLEDSVTPDRKPAARQALASHLQQLQRRPSGVSELAVRINAVSTPHALADLQALAPEPHVDAIVIPKVNGASDLTFAEDVIRHVANDGRRSGLPRLIALIESAQAVMDLREICAASPLLSGLIFAAEDFALDLSLTRTPSLAEFLYARSAIVTAARAAQLPGAIDLVCTAYKGEEGVKVLADECQNGREMGFNGKQCIHPSQVEVVHKMFAPSDEEVEWSVRVLIADEKASESGRGAWTLEGKMIDAPVVGKAQATVAKAKKCGFDTQSLREKWKAQRPE